MLNEELYETLEREFEKNKIEDAVEDILLELAEQIGRASCRERECPASPKLEKQSCTPVDDARKTAACISKPCV